MPQLGVVLQFTVAIEADLASGLEFKTKTIEAQRNPFSARFDIRLFQCPVIEESTFLLPDRKPQQFQVLLRRKETLC